MGQVITVVALFVSLFSHVTVSAKPAGQEYTLYRYDIPPELGNNTSLFDLDEGGSFIVGTYFGPCPVNMSSDCFNAFGFDQDDESFTSYNVENNFINFATAISDLAVVGSTEQPDGSRVGTIWPRNSSAKAWKKILEPLLPSLPKKGPIIVDIKDFLSTSLLGLNNRGHLVGAVQNSNFTFSGFVIAKGQISVFDYPKAQNTFAEGIRKNGTIVGYYDIPNDGTHGFLLNPSGKKFASFDVDVPSACATWIYDTNDAGDLAGAYFDCGSQQVHGYVFTRKKQLIPISYPEVGTFATEVRGLDEEGNIVGRFDTQIIDEYGNTIKERHGFIGLLKE